MDKLATIAVLLLTDLSDKSDETFAKISTTLETSAPIVVDALKWMVKPTNLILLASRRQTSCRDLCSSHKTFKR